MYRAFDVYTQFLPIQHDKHAMLSMVSEFQISDMQIFTDADIINFRRIVTSGAANATFINIKFLSFLIGYKCACEKRMIEIDAITSSSISEAILPLIGRIIREKDKSAAVAEIRNKFAYFEGDPFFANAINEAYKRALISIKSET